MTPLSNDADQNLLCALPNETRKAVVELVGRAYKHGIADAAECIRTEGSGPQYGPTLSSIYRGIADALTSAAETMPVFDLGDLPTPDPTTLSDAEILDLPPLDRAKVIADLAAQGLLVVPMLVDVGTACHVCDGGKVSMVIDGVEQRVDCTRCDGLGVVDGRRRCADRECLSFGEPLTYSLGGGWACSRKHGHAERERADRFVTPADLAAVVKMDPAPATDPDAFPWDKTEETKA
jgi:hypothetical protein